MGMISYYSCHCSLRVCVTCIMLMCFGKGTISLSEAPAKDGRLASVA
jgi:hypothetical protein